MIVQFFSDLHLEFGNHFILDDLFKKKMSDIIIIAGDLHTNRNVLKVLQKIDERTSVPVLFVPGNHEYYGTQKFTLDGQLRHLSTKLKHVHVLIQDTFTFNGIVFAGATGWWDTKLSNVHIYSLNDFRQIYDIQFNDYGTKWGISDREFFERTISRYPNTVCISHNAPSELSISPEYKNSDINECFANKWDRMILKHQPLAWIHGHMHNSCVYSINKTQVGCNPYGYFGYEVNENFVIEGYMQIK